MDVAKGPEKGDATTRKAGIKVFLEKEAATLLSEATMDFSDDRGFIISGMQQTSCCS
jgi:Fe-S cluster assembly iron-binding protein IscA